MFQAVRAIDGCKRNEEITSHHNTVPSLRSRFWATLCKLIFAKGCEHAAETLCSIFTPLCETLLAELIHERWRIGCSKDILNRTLVRLWGEVVSIDGNNEVPIFFDNPEHMLKLVLAEAHVLHALFSDVPAERKLRETDRAPQSLELLIRVVLSPSTALCTWAIGRQPPRPRNATTPASSRHRESWNFFF